jgi:uncharacterized protein YkwD
MPRLHFLIIVSLIGAGVALALLFQMSGMKPWSGSHPVIGVPEQLTGSTPAFTISTAGSGIPTSPLYSTPTPFPSAAPARFAKPTSELTSPPTEATTSATKNPYTISTTALEQRVHELINQQRTALGLVSLRFDTALADIAVKHSEDMAEQHYFAHINTAGQNPTARGTAAGYSCRKNYGAYYTYGIAENLFQNNLYSSATYYSNRETVYDWNSPEEIAQITVAGWMNSSGHRENILTPTFDRVGIGVAISSDDKVYITEDFC